MNHQDTKTPSLEEVDGVAKQIVDAAFKVHSSLGPGLLESVYEVCLAHELHRRGLSFDRQVSLPVEYEGLRLESGLRLDLLVADCVIVEIKAVEALLPVHKAQLLTYLKLSGHHIGLLINFNTPLIKDGIKRLAL
ncbi:MAG: GxxExxY protein [Chthoniobacteraceae bacterium]